MNIGVVGLGLIGGSMAKAFKYHTNHTVYGFDTDEATLNKALLVGATDGKLSAETLSVCDYLFLALYPSAIIKYLSENSRFIKQGAVVIDCGGTKSDICPPCFDMAKKHGYTFIGGHPMAGIQYSGFKYSKENLFKNADMILVPLLETDIATRDKLKKLFLSIGFSNVCFTDAETHDRIIAYTSQLAHVVSNAYVKSPNAQVHKGFSAGSYRDLTRVAKLNEDMWTELFLSNSENLSGELDLLISNLSKYRDAIKNQDGKTLKNLLKEGRECKERADG